LQRSAGRGLTKFVGREREMEALGHAAERATSGHGQIVAAMAEPGVGKSRLYFEFKAKNQWGQRHFAPASVKPHHDSGYHRGALRLIRLTKDPRGVAYRRSWQAKGRSGPTNFGVKPYCTP
jgi:hypothetical protein